MKYAIPMNDVNEVVMSGKRRTRPRSRNGDVWVTTQRGRVSLRITALTGEHLTGSNDYLGNVRIPRKALKAIIPNAPAGPTADGP